MEHTCNCFPIALRLRGMTVATVCFFAAAAAAQTERVIYTFPAGTSAGAPTADLISDSAGNLYGTSTGFNYGSGTVFELVRSSGGWSETTLHTFPTGSADGKAPEGSVIFDKSGNLYGTTAYGGSDNLGIIFELSPPASGSAPWTETVLYSFKTIDKTTNGNVGGGLIFRGNSLFGTTLYGGENGDGNVFELAPNAEGTWEYHVLYTFTGQPDGEEPEYACDALIADSAGNFYGVTSYGGEYDGGTVFEMSPPAAGSTTWTETILHSFNPNTSDADGPVSGLLFDKDGNLYGTANAGGVFGYGAVYELSPPTISGGAWTESILYSFTGGAGGQTPWGKLKMDDSGNLYGTTLNGPVFELSPPSAPGGEWSETKLWDFPGSKNDGEQPESGVIFGPQGDLYGTTYGGGGFGNGTVYAIRP